jgi:hypothetical protein
MSKSGKAVGTQLPRRSSQVAPASYVQTTQHGLKRLVDFLHSTLSM